MQFKKIENNILKIEGPGAQIMAKINLPTALVSFRGRCSHLHGLKDSNSFTKGFVVLVHLEGSIFGLLSIKKECFGRGRAELLAFNKDDHSVQNQIYTRKQVRIETIKFIRHFPQSGALQEEDLQALIKHDIKTAFQNKLCQRRVQSLNEAELLHYVRRAMAEDNYVGDAIRFKVEHKRTYIHNHAFPENSYESDQSSSTPSLSPNLDPTSSHLYTEDDNEMEGQDLNSVIFE